MDVVYLDVQNIYMYIYIYNLKDDISSKILVTNETQINNNYRTIYIYIKYLNGQKKWQMLLKFWKCNCIHIGHGNMDE